MAEPTPRRRRRVVSSEEVTPLRTSANPLNAVPMRRFVPKAQPYLWDGMIPLNLYTIISGDGGSGKSTVLIDRLAKLTVGELEGDLIDIPATVLYCTTENDPNTVIAPRLMAAGADTNRFLVLGGEASRFKLPSDLPKLIATVEGNDVRVVVLDPLSDFLDRDRTHNNYGYVNDILAETMMKLTRLEVTLIGVSHKQKNQRKTGTDSVVGSIAFTSKARCSIQVGKTNDGLSIIGTTKVNQGSPYTGWVFSVQKKPIGRDLTLARIIEADHVEMIRPATKAEVKAMFSDVIDVAADARVQKLTTYINEQGVVETGRAQHMLMVEFKIKERMARQTISDAVAAKLINREHNGEQGARSGYKLSLTMAGRQLMAENDDIPDADDPDDFEDLPDDTFEEFE